jgi:glycerophosphoryl diester phosphodiesterase
MKASRRALTVFALAATAAVLTAGAIAGDKDGGFKTAQPSMIIVPAGSSVTPLITVGDTLPNGYRYESIPDGISFRTKAAKKLDLYVNHETSLVPFPYAPGAPTEATSQNDFDNSQLSHLELNRETGGILGGELAIASAENYQRFCSNFLADEANGFDKPLVFTNEEGIDWVKREGKAFPATIGAADSRQIGVVVAHDPKNGKSNPIWGMGRLNHENSLAVPGYGHPVLLTGDDAFVNIPAQSQVYSYIADDSKAVWRDEGELWAFVSDTPGFNDYDDLAPGSTQVITGHFVKVPKNIATGRNADGTEMMAADAGYPLPPNTGWQTSNGVGIDGPQWVLEHWSDLNDAFQFTRIEDMAYDKRPGLQNVVYLADSGRGTAGAPQQGRSTNGRIWKMVLDKNDPTKVTSLTILIDGDTSPVKSPGAVHQPDNLESTLNGLLITEDPGSSQQFFPADANATTARLMHYRFATGLLTVAARVDQSADEGATDVDATTTPGKWGSWESTGVVDVSSVFGPDTFLINVQAHTLWVEKAPGFDDVAPAGPDYTFKREGGQLALLHLPGA